MLPQKWNIGKINHIAIATPDMDKTVALYRDVLGAKVSEKHVRLDFSLRTQLVDYQCYLQAILIERDQNIFKQLKKDVLVALSICCDFKKDNSKTVEC